MYCKECSERIVDPITERHDRKTFSLKMEWKYNTKKEMCFKCWLKNKNGTEKMAEGSTGVFFHP